eukprot:4003670-Prymnesium_polylepis.2
MPRRTAGATPQTPWAQAARSPQTPPAQPTDTPLRRPLRASRSEPSGRSTPQLAPALAHRPAHSRRMPTAAQRIGATPTEHEAAPPTAARCAPPDRFVTTARAQPRHAWPPRTQREAPARQPLRAVARHCLSHTAPSHPGAAAHRVTAPAATQAVSRRQPHRMRSPPRPTLLPLRPIRTRRPSAYAASAARVEAHETRPTRGRVQIHTHAAELRLPMHVAHRSSAAPPAPTTPRIPATGQAARTPERRPPQDTAKLPLLLGDSSSQPIGAARLARHTLAHCTACSPSASSSASASLLPPACSTLQLNTRRRNAGAPPVTNSPPVCQAALRTTMCAIVPLAPKELTPLAAPLEPLATGASCVGSTHAPACSAEMARLLFMMRSCAPSAPAEGSQWPAFAFTLLATSPPPAPRSDSSTTTNAPTSIGSPSRVPVPCASMHPSCDGPTPASADAARSSPCWAWPLGAVKLALLPSWLTALPRSVVSSPTVPCSSSASVQHASDRTKPSARLSNVWHRPSADVMPAAAKV